MANRTAYLQLGGAMLRIGVLGYGGGPATIPLFRYEAVSRYGWLDDTEFAETLALANTLPGPVATKLAAYLGYRLRGAAGAAFALALVMLPSTFAMVVLAGTFRLVAHYAVVKDMIGAVIPVVAVMLGTLAYQFGKNAYKGLGWLLAVITMVIAWVLLSLLSWSPGIVVLGFLAYGALHPTFKRRFGREAS